MLIIALPVISSAISGKIFDAPEIIHIIPKNNLTFNGDIKAINLLLIQRDRLSTFILADLFLKQKGLHSQAKIGILRVERFSNLRLD